MTSLENLRVVGLLTSLVTTPIRRSVYFHPRLFILLRLSCIQPEVIWAYLQIQREKIEPTRTASEVTIRLKAARFRYTFTSVSI